MITDSTGRSIDVFNLKVDNISLKHIAHSLSLKCRFGGCCTKLYSVAQHCIHASYEGKYPLENLFLLLHDSAEAYLPDFASPDKSRYYFYGGLIYRPILEIEKEILYTIFKKFHLNWSHYMMCQDNIKIVDKRLRDTEGEKFMVNWISSTIPYYFQRSYAMGPEIVEDTFKDRLWDLQVQLGMKRTDLDD